METKTGLIVPLVHLNGASKQRLLQQLEDAYDALQVAYDALRQASPNQRDYYHTPGLYEKALAQHTKRQQAIDDVLTSIQAETEEISFQGA